MALSRTQRFFKRLREELGVDLPLDAYMERTYAGWAQRSSGAWTSVIRSKSNDHFELGLYSPISELLKCPKLELGNSYGRNVDCGCTGKCKGIPS